MAERLRRSTRNFSLKSYRLSNSERSVGSSPTRRVFFFFLFLFLDSRRLFLLGEQREEARTLGGRREGKQGEEGGGGRVFFQATLIKRSALQSGFSGRDRTQSFFFGQVF